MKKPLKNFLSGSEDERIVKIMMAFTAIIIIISLTFLIIVS